MAIEKKKYLEKDNLVLTFKILDIDNNGQLSIDELKKAFEAGGN